MIEKNIGKVEQKQHGKPYYYLKNGLLHKRFLVVRAIPLTKEEEEDVKKSIQAALVEGIEKQSVLEDSYSELFIKKGRDFRAKDIAGEHFAKRFSKEV